MMIHTPLNIKNTSSCLSCPWHPSVVYVEEGVNGHKWWMAQTPFPPYELKPYRDFYELPCIHFSDDGIFWEPIENNPIEELSEEEEMAHDYYSDPHLVYRAGKLELYYRFTILKDKQLFDNKTLLLSRGSVDGFHWSEKKVIADLRKQEDVSIWGSQIISQSVVWHEEGCRCYYVDKSSYLKGRHVLITESENGKKWFKFKEAELIGPYIDPWHIDVQFYDGKYQMIVYDMDRLAWFESGDGVRFEYVSEILRPSSNRYDFYADGLYRACSVKTSKGIWVFFSAKRNGNTYIGLLLTQDRCNYLPVNGMPLIKWLPVVWKPLVKSLWKRV